MSGPAETTFGFQRLDPAWHARVDEARSVEEVLALTRDFVATLTPGQLSGLPERVRGLRVKAEDDIEYWTYKLSGTPADAQADAALVQNLFMHFLHASLRIAQIHRECAAAPRAGP